MGWGEATLERVKLTLRSGLGPIDVELHEVTVGYSPTQFELEYLDIARANVHLRYQASTVAQQSALPTFPLFPLKRASIGQFVGTVDSSWGRAELSGRVEALRGSDDGVNLTVDNPAQSVHVILLAEANTLKASLTAPTGPEILALEIARIGDDGFRVQLDAQDAGRLLETLAVGTERIRLASALKQGTAGLSGAALEVRAEGSADLTRISGRLTHEKRAWVESTFTLPKADAPQAEARIDMPASILFDIAGTWLPITQWRPDTGQATGRVRWQGIMGDAWSASGQLVLSGVAWSNDTLRLTNAELSLDTEQANERGVLLSATLAHAGTPIAWMDIGIPREGPTEIDGRASLAASELFDMAAPRIPEPFLGWRPSAGHLHASTRMQWQPGGVRGTAKVTFEEVSLTLKNTRLEDAWAELNISDLASGHGEFKVEAAALRFSPTVAATGLRCVTKFTTNLLDLAQMSFTLFGGQVEFTPTALQLDGTPVQTAIRIQGLDLARLLRSVDQQGLSGSGTLAGDLPVVLTPNPLNLEIHDGRLRATQGGFLKYRPPVLGRDNIAFQALSHLLYDKLDARVSYSADGDYRLGLRLEGHNPNLLNGHPVALNLNLRGHLPALLRESLLTGDFDRPVLEWANTQKLEKPRPQATPNPMPRPAARKKR